MGYIEACQFDLGSHWDFFGCIIQAFTPLKITCWNTIIQMEDHVLAKMGDGCRFQP